MKHILLLTSLFFAAASAEARIVTSQANGNATSPFTWDCTCIPVDGDTIMINHAVVLDVDYAFTMGGIQVNAGGSITGNANTRIFGVSGGYFLNNGTVNMAYVFHNGGTFTNNASITVTRNAGIDQPVTMVNNGTMNVNDTLLVSPTATFQNAGTVNCPEILNAGMYVNTGSTTADNLWTSGTFMHNSGMLSLAMSIYNSGNVTLNGASSVTQDIFNAENFTVNFYLSARTLYNGDSISGAATFTNNAMISLSQDLWNSETITGNGDFCVADSTINSGSVTGTLDICDLTGGNWDMNFGTVAGTVTYCSSSCTIGVDEVPTPSVTLVPNPAHTFVNVTLSSPASGTIRVTDMTGRLVMELPFITQAQINVENLAPGIYSVMVTTQNEIIAEKMIVE